MSVESKSGKIRVRRLEQDAAIAAPPRDTWVEIRAAELEDEPDHETKSFVELAEIAVPFLVHLPATTRGDFTELAIDLHGPLFPRHPELRYEVELTLRGETIGTTVFRHHTQRHQFFVSTQLLFDDANVLTLTARRLSEGAEVPRFIVRVFYARKDRLLRDLERNSIWVFSTARSGSTWLSQDILCWNGRNRPMDEPGIGKMFAPFDFLVERFYDIEEKSTYFESGFDYETRARVRGNRAVAPFERAFVYAKQENQIWNAQNWNMYLGLLKETVFRHVVNEWGVIQYKSVVFKMPNDSHAADVIMQAFPGSFMIFLMRDGRDVMKSRFSPFASRTLSETRDTRMRRHAIAFYSHFWNFQVDIIHAAFSAHPPERGMFLHYEDLRRNTAERVRFLFDRVGMAITDEQLADLMDRTQLEHIPADQKGPDKPRQTGEIGNYTSVFSVAEIELMESIMGPNLERFGYKLHTRTTAPL